MVGTRLLIATLFGISKVMLLDDRLPVISAGRPGLSDFFQTTEVIVLSDDKTSLSDLLQPIKITKIKGRIF